MSERRSLSEEKNKNETKLMSRAGFKKSKKKEFDEEDDPCFETPKRNLTEDGRRTCKKEACDIQACLQRKNYQESDCSYYLDVYWKCIHTNGFQKKK
jgi:hypothetical protein